MAGLEFKIGADSSELKAEIAKTELLIDKLRKEKAVNVKLGLDVLPLQKSINEAKEQLAKLKKSTDVAGKGFDTMTPKVANGGNTLMQFSRIAQDAPFGIIGIGNNLTATAESFSYLKQQTGSTGGALKALAGSIMGTGGILLAVSLVTTAFTYMAQNGITVKDVYERMTGSFNETANALKKIGEEANKSAQQEIATIKALVSVAKDETKSKQDRLIAVQELQKQYPAYFGNLSQEQVMYGDLKSVIDDVSQALIAKAVAEKVAGKAGDAQYRLYELNALLIKAKEKQIQLEKEYLRAAASTAGATVEPALIAYEKSKNRVAEIREEWVKTKKVLDDYQTILNKTTGDSIKTRASPPPKAPKQKTSVKRDDLVALPKLTIAKDTNSQNDAILKLFREGLSEDLKAFKEDKIVLNIPIQPVISLTPAEIEKQKIQQLIDEFNGTLSQIVTSSTVNSLAGVGEAIGGALASGENVLNAVGKTILSSMGSMLQELGKATIAYGVGLIAIKAAIKNPFTAIAAGVALVAVGSAINGAVAKSSQTALGGGGGGSVSTGSSVSSPTSSTSSGGSSSFTGGTVVFEISGQSLIGVLSNTLDKNRRLGGALSLG